MMWTRLTTKLLLQLVETDSATWHRWWQNQFHHNPIARIQRVQRRGWVSPTMTLTQIGQQISQSIPDLHLIPVYYLPGIVDIHAVMDYSKQHSDLESAMVIRQLLDRAAAHNQDDDVLHSIRHMQLKWDFETQHLDYAQTDVMQLLWQRLGGDGRQQPALNQYDKQLLLRLLESLNWNLDEFEWRFSDWLQTQNMQHSLLTRFEMMQRVMYEVTKNQAAIDELQQVSSERQWRQSLAWLQPIVDKEDAL